MHACMIAHDAENHESLNNKMLVILSQAKYLVTSRAGHFSMSLANVCLQTRSMAMLGFGRICLVHSPQGVQYNEIVLFFCHFPNPNPEPHSTVPSSSIRHQGSFSYELQLA
eukprot:TRINITY_DN11893_c0_g2_i1.p1 TRINITY_DN11893_c0_g2~~TRINITY_DN11893_c0_g2_i1.p1  ORF type:complete len:111 (-),score=2.01 TRINITY_DN11893_c0_g2_i1:39-371(-)